MGNEDVIADLRRKIADMSESGAGQPVPLPSKKYGKGKAAGEKGTAQSGRDESAESEGAEVSEAERAFKKLVDLVNVSDRSEKAMRERLARDDFGEQAVGEAIERAKSYGFIDDNRFADVLIRSRIAQGKGTAGIERELASHDIDASEVPGWPFEYGIDSENELDRALSLLERKPPRSKNLREGAYRKLMQKGFTSSVASSAARMWYERQELAED